MARIHNTDIYDYNTLPTLEDYLIGTDKEDSKRTKNYRLADIVGLLNVVGLPIGGEEGQVLTKASDGDYDIGWEDQSGGLPDAPSDGQIYGRKDEDWELIPTGLPDAPSDGQIYGRKDEDWELIPTGLPDAPSDGETYGRKDGDWELIPDGLPDAPSDGQTYGRKDENWELIPDGGVDWGDIGGVLADQTDLQSALDAKANDNEVVHLTGNENIDGLKAFQGSLQVNGSIRIGSVGSPEVGFLWYPRPSFPSITTGPTNRLMTSGESWGFFPSGTSKNAGIFDYSLISGSNKTYALPNQSGTVALQTAASGSFTTSDAKTVTVVNGIITSIV